MTIRFAAWLMLLWVSGSLAADSAYVRRQGKDFILGSDRVERRLTLQDGQFLLTAYTDKITGRSLLPPGAGVPEFFLAVGTNRTEVSGASGGWTLHAASIRRLELDVRQLVVTLDRPPLRVTRTYVVYPGSSLIREAMTMSNLGSVPLPVSDPGFLETTLAMAGPAAVDFLWMTGAHNIPGSWQLRRETLAPGAARRFDSYDPYPHGPPNQAPSFKPGSASYAPWYSLFNRETRQGVVIGFDYFGHWQSAFAARSNDCVQAWLRLAGFQRWLAPGGGVTTPWAFTALYRDDLDEAGNTLLDWQYTYLWDYTRDGRGGTYPWFPALRTLGYWSKGTGWGQPGVGWTGGNPDLPSTFRKVFRVADYMRQTGTDVYHRDWGWWDYAGDWNGPDFRATGDYLRKSDMGQLIYAFLYTVSKKSKVAAEHPDWLAGSDDDGVTLDLSQPEVVRFIQGQLRSFVGRWGNFTWRNDSTITSEQKNDPSVLLEQDQNFRRILREFLEENPNCAFQAVNGGGNFAGYDYVRHASNIQFSDGVIGPLRNHWSSLLFPPDKNCDNPDQWNPDAYNKAAWRGLLCFNYDTTGDTVDPVKLEGIRELNDLYHYLQTQGLVGRWVRVHRPLVTGDDPTFWFQRLSRDARRSLIIPKHVPSGPVTVRPKGLLPKASYTVSFHESAAEEKRTGADLLANGIRLTNMPPGELIYLNLPLHPGSKLDTTPPKPPTPLRAVAAENMGYPGVELTWKPGTDNNWVSAYEILRNGQLIDKVAKGHYYFDHSAGADPHARYELRTMDGAGNVSQPVAFRPAPGPAARIVDAGPAGGMTFTGDWKTSSSLPSHAGTLHSSQTPGATMELKCEGTRVLVFAKLGADCGRMAISVDGAAPETVDTFSADDIWGVCVWQKSLGGGGEHTVRLTLVDGRHPRSKGNWTHLDGVRVE